MSKEQSLQSTFFVDHGLCGVFRRDQLLIEVDNWTEALTSFLIDPSFGNIDCALGG